MNAGKQVIGDATLHLGDCLELMRELPSASIDMILCDLPYGTTSCKWDSVIPFESLWAEYKRLAKPGAAIVLTASQPFTSALIASNYDWFRYCWVWNKSHASNPLNAKKRPMLRHEDVAVFCGDGLPIYHPQMQPSEPFRTRTGKKLSGIFDVSEHHGARPTREFQTSTQRYPTTDLYFGTGARSKSVHPTQKPVALMEYLIRTYSNEGDAVLDNTMGSGTTGVACMNTARRFIGMEQLPRYFDIACDRIRMAVDGGNSPEQATDAAANAQPSLFELA